MTQEEILIGNKLIAEFEYNSKDWNYLNAKLCIFESHLKYHSSWDWLMKVVEKIASLEYEIVFEIKPNWEESTFSIYDCKHGNSLVDLDVDENYNPRSLIEYVWIYIVDFIKWHSERNK